MTTPSSTLVETDKFLQLTKYDNKKGFIPIMDGNQYILTDGEERSSVPRTIVIYGGGGTAAACYRKGFFGHDVRTESLALEGAHQKNKVLWIAKQFDKAGTGKLVTHALKAARGRDELIYAELTQVTPMLDGTLLLFFKTTNDSNPKTLQISCDQFIYSIGQDDMLMRQICMEIESDLSLNFDKDMVLNIQSTDKSIRFFGAAAMAVRERDYMTATWSWLRSQNIGGDVGPGSMPPSRAQIKRYNALNGILPQSINANMDSTDLIIDYLQRVGVTLSIAQQFADDLLFVRKQSTSGANYTSLLALLKKHSLTDTIDIEGHGHLTARVLALGSKAKSNHALLSWLPPVRQTEDASLFVSTVRDNSPPQQKDRMLTSHTGLVTIKVTN